MSVSIRLLLFVPVRGVEFATELPPKSPERREDPTTWPGLDTRFLAFLSGEGGFEPPHATGYWAEKE